MSKELESAFKEHPMDIDCIGNAFTVEIDYSAPLKTKMRWARLDHIDPRMENCRISTQEKGKKTKIVKFFHFLKGDAYIPVHYPIHIMNIQGYKPGDIQELCSLAMVFPYLSLYFPIIGMNSFWLEGDFIHIPALDNCTHPDQKQLVLYQACTQYDVLWPKHCRFLGIRDRSL